MTRALSFLCLAALAAPLVVAPDAAAAADVVGRAGRVEVTSAELRAYVETLGDDERRALAKDPSQRFPGVRELGDALQEAWRRGAQARKTADREAPVTRELEHDRGGLAADVRLKAVIGNGLADSERH